MRASARSVPVLLALAAVGTSARAAQLAPPREDLGEKQVAAPASDVVSGRVRLPEPAALAQRSELALLPIEPRPRADGRRELEALVPVEIAGPLGIAVVAPELAGWRVLAGPAGAPLRDLEELQRSGDARRDAGRLGPGAAWSFDGVELLAAEAGAWRVRVELPRLPGLPRPAVAGEPEGWLLVRTAGPTVLESHLTTLELLADRAAEGGLGVALRVAEVGPGGEALEHGGTLERAEARVRWAGGDVVLAARDDGLHGDGAAGDGLFGVRLPARLAGEATVDLLVRGRTAEGRPFLRTARHAFRVLERRALLTGEARGVVEEGTRLSIELGTWVLGGRQKLQVAAEVWAERPGEGLVPVCWLARMAWPEVDAGGRARVRLELDGRWLDLAGASGRLELRQVRLQDPDTSVPFHVLERVPLDAPPAAAFAGLLDLAPGAALPREMLTGRAPAGTATAGGGPAQHVAPLVAAPALMLVHGWCSGGAVWPPAHFTPPKTVFLDPDANRTHDEFAQLLRAFGSGLGSYGVVGHSQGGMAALHLYTYYWSGLDQARGPRRIQSVGTPYQGTPLASFGFFLCGTNPDLTPAGAAAWLAGIPSWARAEVHYWTTSNAGAVCNSFTNFLLGGGINDGVTRLDLDQLPGGVSMGHTLGWCHTSGMSEPAQYLDATRNAGMDANAAR